MSLYGNTFSEKASAIFVNDTSTSHWLYLELLVKSNLPNFSEDTKFDAGPFG